MNTLKGKLHNGKTLLDVDEANTDFFSNIKYPQGINPNYYKPSLFSSVFFIWAGQLVKKLIRADVSFLDYPPQPNPTAVRRLQFHLFARINSYLASHRVNLSKNKDKPNNPPLIILKSVFAIFGDKILSIVLLGITISLLSSGQLLLIKWFLKAFSNDPTPTLWSFLYISAILTLITLKVLLFQQTYFFVGRCQEAIASSLSYTIFRLGISRRKEYHNCDCGQREYGRTMRNVLRKRDKLYLRRFEVQLESSNENKCKNGTHKAEKDRINTLCPAQQSQGEELSKSMYMYFFGDTRFFSKFVQVILTLTELLTQMILSIFTVYNQVGKYGAWALAVPFVYISLTISTEILNAYLLKKYFMARDRRIYASYQLCVNAQSILMQGLEHASKDFVSARRWKEVILLKWIEGSRYFVIWLSNLVQSLSIVPIFITILYSNDPKFSPESAVTVIHSVKLIAAYMRELPINLATIIDTMIAMNRLDFYLSQRNPEKGPPIGGFRAIQDGDHKFELTFENATFSYILDAPPVLKNISVHLVPGDILFLCGRTASGKSSFIKAVLGELCLNSGTFAISSLQNGRPIYYVPQKLYNPPGTFMTSLLGDLPFNKDIYNLAISAAELTQDLEKWDDGHERLIDENANSLSGGQRVRMSLAKMIYAYLFFREKKEKKVKGSGELICMDEIFTSLDISVSTKIFQNLFATGGIFSQGDVCVIMTMGLSTLNVCWQKLSDYIPSEINCRVCELIEGQVAELSTVEDYLGPSRLIPSPPYTAQNSDEFNFKTKKEFMGPISTNQDSNDEFLKGVISAYSTYFRHAGIFSVFLTFIMTFTAFCTKTYFNLALVNWSDQVVSSSPPKKQIFDFVLKLFICLGVEVLFSLLAIIFWYLCAMSASRNYHDSRTNSIITRKRPNTKSVGKLLTEFTVDQYIIDRRVHYIIHLTFSRALNLAFQIGTMVYIYPFALLAFMVITIVGYYLIVRNYLNVNQLIQASVLKSMSGVNLTISQGIHGMELMRAFGTEGRLFSSFLEKTDYFYRAQVLRWCISSWALITYTLFGVIIFSLLVELPMMFPKLMYGQITGRPGNFVYVLSLFITINDMTIQFILNMGYVYEYMITLISSHTNIHKAQEVTVEPIQSMNSLLEINGLAVSYSEYDPVSKKKRLLTSA